ncbi:Hairy/enhancer-of-split with YRPW motif protein 2 [Coniosporium tulheliwenetii]|uniref:Hairy/enhancer-of-split with YRPW motif protein 2 n=1 Tax=Coniosporium tulheliwenetii TaxID=3383036 RepID=A0ACC2YHH8_9PEZI|nr:Hairy/enhancer-of-split with YRPW motif protein 2 [Cladosporium sp. JES 115]
MPSSISPADQVKQVWTSDDDTMAKQTATTRWPKIVQGTIDDVGQTAAQSSCAAQREESFAIQSALKEMKDEMLQNKALPRIQTIFARSRYWQTYDVFKRQKDSTFAKSRAAVEELASRYMHIITDSSLAADGVTDDEAKKLLFIEMTEIALWGNATDLSLLSNLSLEQIQSLQGRKPSQSPKATLIDIILDNAGFEFFTDVLYASYLLESGLASSIRFHVKDFPWFVSDVTSADVDSLFSHLQSPEIFPSREYLDRLLRRLSKHFDSGALTVIQHPFWTAGCSFHKMHSQAPDLVEDLKASSLVIFKGDLNYRKLVKDGLWPHTTPFKDALGPLGSKSGLKILALRTNKADVCVGIDSQSRVDALNEEAPHGAWIRNGKYAVVSFSDGE